MNSNLIAVIPAAGRPTNKIVPNSNLPDTMTSINGKPVIGHIIDSLLEKKISHINITLNSKDVHTERYVYKTYNKKVKELNFVYHDEYERGIGYSIFLSLENENLKDKEVLVCLGDTIFTGPLKFKENFLLVSSNYEEVSKWCFVEHSDKKVNFIDKPAKYEGSGKILCGIYFFTNGIKLKRILNKYRDFKGKVELKNILDEFFKKEEVILLNENNNWYDCGNIENFYKARVDFLKSRSFNSLRYDDKYGFITKTSKNKMKLREEINWYLNIPNELKIFTPRLIDYRISSKKVEYSLEYYGYQSLADLYIFNSLNFRTWKVIIKKLFEVVELFREYKTKIPFYFYHEVYIQKTRQRLKEMESKKFWKELFKQESIVINNKKYKNIPYFLNKLEDYVEKLYKNNDMCFIHGDLNMSNILFDTGSKLFKLIDPRGNFGETSIYGDVKYDVAKLRHSFNGRYDFIIRDLFFVDEADGEFKFEVHYEPSTCEVLKYFDKVVKSNNFDINQIKFIEALLFFSMLPLHSDSHDRQLAMYLTGIKIFNEIKYFS
jgi:dTDP-glucose pyrophosphorylase/thiamine kinase-like enzyme